MRTYPDVVEKDEDYDGNLAPLAEHLLPQPIVPEASNITVDVSNIY